MVPPVRPGSLQGNTRTHDQGCRSDAGCNPLPHRHQRGGAQVQSGHPAHATHVGLSAARRGPLGWAVRRIEDTGQLNGEKTPAPAPNAQRAVGRSTPQNRRDHQKNWPIPISSSGWDARRSVRASWSATAPPPLSPTGCAVPLPTPSSATRRRSANSRRLDHGSTPEDTSPRATEPRTTAWAPAPTPFG